MKENLKGDNMTWENEIKKSKTPSRQEILDVFKKCSDMLYDLITPNYAESGLSASTKDAINMIQHAIENAELRIE